MASITDKLRKANSPFAVLLRRAPVLLMAAALCCGPSQRLRAHGDLEVQIDAVSAEIDRHPNDAQLYLKRAELYRNVEHFLFASDDLDQAAKLDPSLALIHLARARNYLAWKKPALGLPEAEAFLKIDSRDAQTTLAQEVRGQLLLALERPLDAAAAFTAAIRASHTTSPDLYMYRVAALEAAGEQHLPAAIASLEEGIAALGPLVSLMQPALELEIRLGRYDPALARIAQITAALPRKEVWLARRGEVLLQAGRPEQARAAFEQALEKISLLPERVRATKSTQDLESRIQSRLRELSGPAIASRNSTAIR